MTDKTCISTASRSAESVVENVYSIIDSKIQYLDYQTKELVRPLSEESTPKETVTGAAKSDSFVTLHEAEQLFLHFEKQSRFKKLLLLTRRYLDNDNALLILSLLADDLLLNFNEKDLAYLLDIPPRLQAA